MKVTMKDLENLSWAYNLWEDRILDSTIDDKDEQRQKEKEKDCNSSWYETGK